MALITAILIPFFFACLVFIPLERLFALSPDQKILRRGWVVDLTHVVVTGFLYALGVVLLKFALGGSLESLVPESLRQAIVAQPLFLQVIEIVFLADVGFYFVHRAFHAVPILWRFHTVHHSIEELDFLAGFRVHPIDQILTRGATLLPVFALGFEIEAIGIFTLLYRWHSQLLHSNIDINFGPLKWVIASPLFHHWHHANLPEATDKNFAAQFVLLDWIFGTLYMPQAERPQKYGINTPVPRSYSGQLIHPFRRPPVTAIQQPDAGDPR